MSSRIITTFKNINDQQDLKNKDNKKFSLFKKEKEVNKRIEQTI